MQSIASPFLPAKYHLLVKYHDKLGWTNFLEGRVFSYFVQLQREYISTCDTYQTAETWALGLMRKASMVGFTLLSRSYYYLRRRSPGPPLVPARPPSGRGTGGYNIIAHWDKSYFRDLIPNLIPKTTETPPLHPMSCQARGGDRVVLRGQ